jgi:hypothetical protein
MSPVDGEVITNQRQEKEYMKKKGLVRPGDFGNNEGRDFFDRARQGRQDFLDGKSVNHAKEVKSYIADSIHRLQQGQKPAKPIEPGE